MRIGLSMGTVCRDDPVLIDKVNPIRYWLLCSYSNSLLSRVLSPSACPVKLHLGFQYVDYFKKFLILLHPQVCYFCLVEP